MTQLYLLRHGLAVPHGEPGMADEERPLTSKGEKRIKQVARGLRRLGLKLDRIFTSPLPRARRTAEIAAEVLDLEERLEDVDVLRADRDPVAIREWLGNRPEARLMLVGHNPVLSDLAALLIAATPGTKPIELRKGGIAALTGSVGSPMKLDWLARPRLIRRFGEF